MSPPLVGIHGLFNILQVFLDTKIWISNLHTAIGDCTQLNKSNQRNVLFADGKSL